MKYLAWGLLLMTTNGLSTLVSRARNTPSYAYHGVTAMLNHAVWGVTNFVFVGFAVDLRAFTDPRALATALAFYTAFSTAGSIAAHVVSMHLIENSDRRRVGGLK